MKRNDSIRYSHTLIGLSLFAATFLGCGEPGGNSTPETPRTLLGTYEMIVDTETGDVWQQPVAFSSKLKKFVPSTRVELDGPELAAPTVSVSNCAPADWNSTTKIVSVNYKVTNIDATKIYSDLILVIQGQEQSWPNRIQNMNMDGPSGYFNNGTLASHDSLGGSADGLYDDIWPGTGLNVWPGESGPYQTLSGTYDGALNPSESTDCTSTPKFLQFTLNASSGVQLRFWYSVFGTEITGSLPTLTVSNLNSAAPYTLTKNTSFTVNGTGGSAGATVYVKTGLNTFSSAVGGGGAWSVNVTGLSTDTTNVLEIYQVNGTNISNSVFRSLIQDSTAPVLASSSPVHNQTSVNRNTNIYVDFSELNGLDTTSFVDRTTVFLDRNGSGGCSAAVVNGTISFSTDNRQLIFNPSAALTNSCPYRFRIYGADQANSIKDSAGNSLTTTQTIDFTVIATSADTTLPYIVGVFPAENANEMSKRTLGGILFSEPMDTATFTATNCNSSAALANIALIDDSNTSATGAQNIDLTWNATGTKVDIALDPTNPDLTAGNDYALIIGSCITDLAGNQLPNFGALGNTAYNGTQTFAYYGFFETAASTDTTAPTLQVSIPRLSSTSSPQVNIPAFVFSEPIKNISDATAYITVSGSSSHIPLVLRQSIGGQTIFFEPLSTFSTSTNYVMSVSAGIQDMSSNNLASPQTSNFTVTATADSTAPTVASTLPATGATGQTRYTKMYAWFSEPIDPDTVTNENVKLSFGGGANLDKVIQVANDGLSIEITPGTYPLNNTTVYTWQLNPAGASSTIKDKAGNALATTTYTFTTATDGTAPSLTSIVPASGATGVALNSIIQLLINEELNPAFFKVDRPGDNSGYINVKRGANTQIALGQVDNFAPGQVVFILNPYLDMTASSTYTTQIEASGLRDRTGNQMSSVSRSFTTGTTTDTTAPTISSTSPTSGATNVATGSTITVTFAEAYDIRSISGDSVFLINSKGNRIGVRMSTNNTFTTLTLTPTSALSATEDYYLYVTTEVRDTGGNRLGSTQKTCFSTDASAATCP